MLRRTRLASWAVISACIALAVASAAHAHGPRLVVRLNEPFEVNGRSYPGGLLMLRSVAHYNPAASLDEVWVDNECLGLWVASKSPRPKASSHDSVLFERNALGRLVLVGYNLRGSRTDTAYRYRSRNPLAAGSPAAEPTLAAR